MRRLHFLYHELRRAKSEYSYALGISEFEQHLDLFARLRKTESHGLWPEITFDDGHISNVEYALPALQSRGLTAQFFITVGWTGKRTGFLGWPELRLMQDSGQLIGAHGWSHIFLTRCCEADLKKELSEARLLLEDKLGTQVTAMSLPGGRFNRRVLAACREAGYKQVYTSAPKIGESSLEGLIGRVNVCGDLSLEEIQNLLQPGSPTLLRLERQYRIKTMAKKLIGDWAYEKLWVRLNRREEDRGDGGNRPK